MILKKKQPKVIDQAIVLKAYDVIMLPNGNVYRVEPDLTKLKLLAVDNIPDGSGISAPPKAD